MAESHAHVGNLSGAPPSSETDADIGSVERRTSVATAGLDRAPGDA
jgi:hypothetical protein